jgi:hypothetical protein
MARNSVVARACAERSRRSIAEDLEEFAVPTLWQMSAHRRPLWRGSPQHIACAIKKGCGVKSATIRACVQMSR